MPEDSIVQQLIFSTRLRYIDFMHALLEYQSLKKNILTRGEFISFMKHLVSQLNHSNVDSNGARSDIGFGIIFDSLNLVLKLGYLNRCHIVALLFNFCIKDTVTATSRDNEKQIKKNNWKLAFIYINSINNQSVLETEQLSEFMKVFFILGLTQK